MADAIQFVLRLDPVQVAPCSSELESPPELDGTRGVHGLTLEGTSIRCQVDPDALGEVLRILAAAGVRSLVSQPPTLEELFLRHYQTETEPAATTPAG